MSSRKVTKEGKMTLADTARRVLGKRGVTMRAFADLTGVALSTVSRRVYGNATLNETARSLYRLIMELSKAGLAQEALEALESVSSSDRDEAKAYGVLIKLALDSGHAALVRSAVSGEEDQEMITVDESAEDVIRHMKALAKSFLRKSKTVAKQNPEVARHYEEIASKQNMVALEAETALDEERAQLRAKSGDDGGGGG